MAADQRTDPLESVSMPKLLFWALLLYLAWHWRDIPQIITSGELPGPDDYLRLHMAQSWWAGQNWLDLSISRMIGNDLHWSRIPDIPIALMSATFSFVLPDPIAWRLTAILWPMLLFLATMSVLVWICDQVAGQTSRILVLLFAGLNAFAMTEFAPGRIDHHNIQIVLLLTALASMFMSTPNRIALGVGISVALSVAIGLEILVLFVPILAAIALCWMLGFPNGSAIIARTGLVLGIASVLLFAATVPSEQYFAAYCDANSIVYLVAMGGTAISFILLGSWSRILGGTEQPNPVRRLVAGLILASILGFALITLFPHCLGGPLESVSTALHERWLSNVVEAHGLIDTANASTERWISGVGYLVVMLAIAVLMTWKRWKQVPELWVILFVLIVCAAVSMVQVRVLRTGIFSAIPFCVLFAATAIRWLDQAIQQRPLRMALQVFLCAVLTSYVWSVAAIPFATVKASNPTASSTVSQEVIPPQEAGLCFAEQDYDELRELPSGLVMSDLNLAPAVLVHTAHSAVSGPYHRNEDEILQVYDFFQSNPDQSHTIAKTMNLSYVATCRLNSGIEVIDQRHVNALIARNEPPSWLEPISGSDANLLIFRVSR